MTEVKESKASTHSKVRYRLLCLVVVISLSFFAIRASDSSFVFNAESKRSEQPNILLILADDLGWSDIAPYGGEVQTPNLHRLAMQGLRFTQFHNTSKCGPSRASLLTGLYAQQVGMSTTTEAYLENSVTLAEVLKSAGYRTLMVGKYHGLDNPYDRGFDRYFGLRDGATNHFNPGHQRLGEVAPAQKKPGRRHWCIDSECIQPYTPTTANFYSTDTYTDKALEYLVEYKDEHKPFFLYVSYQAPHDPLQAWPDDIAKYRGQYGEAGYRAIAEKRYNKQKMMGLIDDSYTLPEPIHDNWDHLSPDKKDIEDQKMSVYAAMIDRMDQNIGRLIEHISESGELDNTLILFASDNGSSAAVVNLGDGEIGEMSRWASLGRNWANVSNTPFRYFKGHSYQGGINTPLIVHWPAVINEGGRITDFVGHFIDVMATIVDISSATYPKSYNGRTIPYYEGQSLLSVFRGHDSVRTAPLFWEWRTGRAARSGKWKIVSSNSDEIGGNGDWELYDMSVDKTETQNLADEMPHVIEQLDSLYKDWWADLPIKSARG